MVVISLNSDNKKVYSIIPQRFFSNPNGDIEAGSFLYNSTINKQTWWNGTKWIEFDGAIVGVNRNGATANRPVGSSIYVGFMYFDTTLGKPIYAKSINSDTVTWVDATGATI